MYTCAAAPEKKYAYFKTVLTLQVNRVLIFTKNAMERNLFFYNHLLDCEYLIIMTLLIFSLILLVVNLYEDG